ncbi:MAG: Na/Pi cotransporter family protein [Paludibacteraceae bacterium]|nr:Na/Pi cotransporter family protein [Paludibacteraceae bacterium]
MNDFTVFDFFCFAGAAGILLYGLKLFSEGLQKLFAPQLRSLLKYLGNKRFVGGLIGLLMTIFVQSSSSVIISAESFVNAGILNVTQAVLLVFGANVGTTLSAWLIAVFGFKFPVAVWVLPLIAISLPFVFSTNGRRKSMGEVLMGFSLLFAGFGLMQSLIPELTTQPELLAFLSHYGSIGAGMVLMFVLIGVLLTVVAQSSVAVVVLSMILCSKGYLPFSLGVALIVGVNLGATVMPNIAAIQANLSAKRVALTHTLFNAFGVIWALLLLGPIVQFITLVMVHLGWGDPTAFARYMYELDPRLLLQINDPNAVLTPSQLATQEAFVASRFSCVLGLAFFHTLFNMTNALLLVGFDRYLMQFVERLLPDRKGDEKFRLSVIEGSMLPTSEISLIQADKEISVFAERCTRMFGMIRSLYWLNTDEDIAQTAARIAKYEDICDRMEVEIANYLTHASEGRLNEAGKRNVHVYLRVVSEIESLGDAFYAMSRHILRKRQEGYEYIDELNEAVEGMFDLVAPLLNGLLNVLRAPDMDARVQAVTATQQLQDPVRQRYETLKMQNAGDIKERRYPFLAGVSYMDLMSECLKVADTVISIIDQYRETSPMR